MTAVRDAVYVNAKTSPEGVIRIVRTDEYEAKKGPGIAAPWPGHEAVYIPAWADDVRVYWRSDDDAEWQEVERPTGDEKFECRPDESVRIAAPPALGLEMW